MRMCMQCVAQAAPYVAGSVIGLRVMATSARRRAARTACTAQPPSPGDDQVPTAGERQPSDLAPASTPRV